MKNKSISLLVVTIIIMFFTSCATKIPFELTCLNCIQSQRINCKEGDCPQTIMVGIDCIATIDETGEKINLNYILTQEKILLASGIPLTLAKIRGRYFVTGAKFKKLWVLTPYKNQAKVCGIAFPFGESDIAPVFEITGNNLLIKNTNKNYILEYDIDSKKWVSNSIIKAGE